MEEIIKKVMSSLIVSLFIIGLFSTAAIAFAEPQGSPLVVDLIAGQYINAGYAEIWDDGVDLHIDIFGVDWVITETHVAIGQVLSDIPQTKSGNPKVGKFEYKNGLSYVIPLGDISEENIIIAIHAVVEGTGAYCGQEETAWARATCEDYYFEFPGSSWATYVVYYVA